MIKLVKIEGGIETTMEFQNTVDAAKTLGMLFGGTSASEIEAQERRQALNNELRAAFQRGKSSNSISEALKNAGL